MGYIYDLQLLCSTDAVECHFDVKLAKYLVVGSLGVLMTRRDISSLAVKGLIMLGLHRLCNETDVSKETTVAELTA